MVRAIATAFLVTAAVTAGVILAYALEWSLFSGVPEGLLIAAPILLGVLAAWVLPGRWPDREAPRWSIGIGFLVVVAAALGLVLGGFVGVWVAFATGLVVIGY